MENYWQWQRWPKIRLDEKKKDMMEKELFEWSCRRGEQLTIIEVVMGWDGQVTDNSKGGQWSPIAYLFLAKLIQSKETRGIHLVVMELQQQEPWWKIWVHDLGSVPESFCQ